MISAYHHVTFYSPLFLLHNTSHIFTLFSLFIISLIVPIYSSLIVPIRTDAEFSFMARQRMLNDGTTAVTAVIHDRKIFVANAGDSRAILVQKGGHARHLSVDHKPNR